MTTVLTYGTFDLLHIGHINLLKRARSLGDRLIVALSTDQFNLAEKNKISVNCYQDRKTILESIRFVDQVIPEEGWDQKLLDIETYKIDIFTIGDDWQGHFDFLQKKCQVIYLPRTANISTTEIKQQIIAGPNSSI
jgi:glycerol-3-phosphate cytidylyltransferase